MSNCPIFNYLNSKNAQKELKDMTWVSFTDKYNDTNLCLKNNGWNVEVNGNIRPKYFPAKENVVKFYDLLGERIELALNLVKGFSNEELKARLKAGE